MAKKSGLFALLAGVAAGAAAVFLSEKENRQMAEREIKKVKTSARNLAQDLDKNPQKVARKVVRRGKKVAAVAVGKSTKTKVKKVVKAAKKVSSKAKSARRK
jgi:gas vesicle protein